MDKSNDSVNTILLKVRNFNVMVIKLLFSVSNWNEAGLLQQLKKQTLIIILKLV